MHENSETQNDELRKDLNECLNYPCINYKQQYCVDLEDGFKCICMPGYKGKDCDEIVEECFANPCNENGYCLDIEGNG